MSLTGVRHRLAAQVCEDAYAWAHEGDLLAVAVADGLGSLDGSAGAARRAVEAAVQAAVQMVRAAAQIPGAHLLPAVAAAAEAAGGGGATTLVLGLIAEHGDVSLVRVGDSTAFLVGHHGDFHELFEGPEVDRVGTATAALPLPSESPGIEEVAETVDLQLAPGEVLVLASDGVSDPWRDGPTTVGPAFAQALVGRPTALDLACLAGFSRQGCHDDRTILCAWRRDPPGGS